MELFCSWDFNKKPASSCCGCSYLIIFSCGYIRDRRYNPHITSTTMTIQAANQYMMMTSSFGGTPPLNVGAGYGVVLGFGVFFSLFASFATFLDNRYAGTVSTRWELAPASLSQSNIWPDTDITNFTARISTLRDATSELDLPPVSYVPHGHGQQRYCSPPMSHISMEYPAHSGTPLEPLFKSFFLASSLLK